MAVQRRPATAAAAKPSADDEGRSTTHLTVADRWGNVVSYTFTIEQIGGSGIVVPGRGFLLNNELTDFNFADRHGQLARAGKRPRSSMAPTIVLDHGRPVVALGSPGGATIITTVLQILVHHVDFGMSLPDAIAAPRASQRNARRREAEPAFIARYGAALRARGHDVRRRAPRRSARRPASAFRATGASRRRRSRRDAAAGRRWWCARASVRARVPSRQPHPKGGAVLDVDDRLAELEDLGLYRRMRMVSGPQGPRVVLDGRPVLLLCSENHLGLADHPRVREAAADAAMRWGAGAGAARPASGR